MARCPFAEWMPISGPSGSYTGGPFKIVHHTTEGSSAQGAFAAFRTNRSDPHFTVDSTTIYQHVDTGEASRALRNAAGGVQTNRDSAIQIEVVGFAHRPKVMATLKNVQKLCNWLEATHDIPKVWPNGPPKPAVNGHDPGGHNRNAANWDQKGGHYGHSQVPENTHWDPGYTASEAAFVIADAASEAMEIEGVEAIPLEDPRFYSEVSTMPDHADPHGAEAPVEAETDAVLQPARARKRAKKKVTAKKVAASKAARGTKKTASKKAKKAGKKAAKKIVKKAAKKARRKAAGKASAKSSKRANWDAATSSKSSKKKAARKEGGRKTAIKRKTR